MKTYLDKECVSLTLTTEVFSDEVFLSQLLRLTRDGGVVVFVPNGSHAVEFNLPIGREHQEANATTKRMDWYIRCFDKEGAHKKQ